MPKHISLYAALSAAVLAVTLTACSTPTPAPMDEPTETPVETPVGTGDWTPDAAWFDSVTERKGFLHDYVGYWDAQSCTMDKVIGGDFNCNIQISGLTEGINDLNDLLAQTVDIAPDSVALIEGLDDAAATAAAGAENTAAYSDLVCDFSPDDSCAEPGDALVESARELDAALAGWTAP